MQFIVNGKAYPVRRRWNLTFNGGVKADGLCTNDPRAIWLDAELCQAELLNILRHELAHAFQFETGSPSEFEQIAVFTAAVGEAFDEQFHAQGGLAAIRLIEIEGTRKRPRIFALQPVAARVARRKVGA